MELQQQNQKQQHVEDDDHRVKKFYIILSFLQDTLNIEKLAQRYVDMISNENNEVNNKNNEEDDIKSKIQDLLCCDSPTLILNDILSFSSDNNNVHVLSDNVSDNVDLNIFDTSKLQPDFRKEDQDLVLEMNTNKVPTSQFLCNDARSQKNDAHSVSFSSTTKRLYEIEALDSPLDMKRQKTFHNNKIQKQSRRLFELNMSLKSRRLFELYHATKCTHDDDSSFCSPCCPVSKHCSEMKHLWIHMENCHDGLYCQYRHCKSSRNVLTHYEKCVHKQCPVCTSFRYQIKTAKSKEKNCCKGSMMCFDTSQRSLSSNTSYSTATTTASNTTASSRRDDHSSYYNQFI